jgi:uncharacterized protein
MKADLLEILCCPVCRGDLTLTKGTVEGEEIVTGTLTCPKCSTTYPITDAIPDLLPPDQRT